MCFWTFLHALFDIVFGFLVCHHGHDGGDLILHQGIVKALVVVGEVFDILPTDGLGVFGEALKAVFVGMEGIGNVGVGAYGNLQFGGDFLLQGDEAYGIHVGGLYRIVGAHHHRHVELIFPNGKVD